MGFLRAGCLLTLDPDDPGIWHVVERTGERSPVCLDAKTACNYAVNAAASFGVGENRRVQFDQKRAMEDAEAARKGKK